uniref:Uncharacterized protein n=1 Tax=Arundo donax TaxID=35708 RepID=A0A0A9GJC7_ARUDO
MPVLYLATYSLLNELLHCYLFYRDGLT